MEIIVATKNHLQELLFLDNLIFKETAYGQSGLLSELIENNRLYLIAYKNNKPVGFVGASVVLDTADIMKIGVIPEFRNQGVARTLLSNILELLKKQGVLNIMLEVRESNFQAKQLYKKLHFQKISTRSLYYSNGENAEIYQCKLNINK